MSNILYYWTKIYSSLFLSVIYSKQINWLIISLRFCITYSCRYLKSPKIQAHTRTSTSFYFMCLALIQSMTSPSPRECSSTWKHQRQRTGPLRRIHHMSTTYTTPMPTSSRWTTLDASAEWISSSFVHTVAKQVQSAIWLLPSCFQKISITVWCLERYEYTLISYEWILD